LLFFVHFHFFGFIFLNPWIFGDQTSPSSPPPAGGANMLIRQQVQAFALVPLMPFRYTRDLMVEKVFRLVARTPFEILQGVFCLGFFKGSQS
jgi:hypothetical protein